MKLDHSRAAGRSPGRVAAGMTAFAFAFAIALGHGAAFAQPPGAMSAPAPGAVPAEVPEAVRIERPSDAEIATARRALQNFVASADAQTRAVLTKYPDLVDVRPPPPNSAIVPNLAPFFQQKHQDNLRVAREGDAELLLMGDSITDFWRNADGDFAGKPVLDEHFGHWKIANFGIAGDTTQGVLYRLRSC